MPSKKKLKKRIRNLKHDRNGWRDAIDAPNIELNQLRTAARHLVTELDDMDLEDVPEIAARLDALRQILDMQLLADAMDRAIASVATAAAELRQRTTPREPVR